MDSDVFCVLCGGPFHLEHHIYNIDPDTEAYQWLFDIRLLGSLSSLGSLRMTNTTNEPPNVSGSDDVFLSEKTRWLITDFDFFPLGDSYYHVLNDDPAGNVLFPLHYACIQIGCRVLPSRPKEPTESTGSSYLALLYRTLRSHFHYSKYVSGGIGHDLFELFAERNDFGPRSLLAMDDLGWWGDAHEKFLVDPINVPGLTSFLSGALQATPRRMREHYLPTPLPTREPQGLERLPNELLHRMSEFLPGISIIALHRTSRALALKIPLDDRFWRKYLLNGSLVPHVWDLDAKQLECLRKERPEDVSSGEFQWDWRSLVQFLFKRQFPVWERDSRLDGIPLGFWNRCRIWNIMEEACHHDWSDYPINPWTPDSEKAVSTQAL